MRLFRNLRVTVLMLIVGAMPGLAALGFAAQHLTAVYAAREATASLARQVALIAELSYVAHELQRERDASVARLGPDGEDFADELADQRDDTDVEVANLARQRALLDGRAASPEFLARLDGIADALQGLAAQRATVDRGSAAAAAVTEWYSGIIDGVVGSVGVLAGISHEPAIARGLSSYHFLLLAKDAMALKRAAGLAGTAEVGYPRDALRRFDAVQAGMMALFREAADPALGTFLDSALSDDSTQDAQEMLAMMLADPAEAVAPRDWFDTTALVIDNIKNVEDTLVFDLLDRMEASVAASDRTLLMNVVIGAAGLLLSLLLSGAMILGVRRAFRQVTAPMAGMARGATDVVLPPPSRNEFGEIAEALAVFKATAEEKARLDAEAAERTAAALLRADAMEALRRSLGAAVAAASAGDFGARVGADTADADLAQLAEAVNGLLETTGAALDGTVRVLTALAAADLTARMDGSWSGDFARLRDGVEATATGLAQVVRGIRTAAGAALVRAGEIEAAARELAARTEAQAASLEETAATMEEMSATVRSNAEALATAETLSHEARERTRGGRETVGSAVEAVGRIEDGARRIGEIVGVIDGIAFQTNLLALNAGVEAARAGDAGRGFAVVAFEVRALAQRCTEAARDIGALIRESGQSVRQGVEMVHRTGEALAAIEGTIETLATTIADVATAGREQAGGIGEINQAVASMDLNTQQNAGMADASLQVASALREEIGRLDALVAAFRLDAQAEATVSRRRA